MKKGFVISWYFPPINSSEGLVTFKLLKNSKYKYDVYTQKNNESWSYGSKETNLVSENINTIFSKSNSFEGWIQEGIEYFQKNSKKYDFIMSRSMAPESHIIAMKIKEKFPNIKWIASFGDPIADNPFNYFSKQKSPYSIRKEGIDNVSIKYLFSLKRIIKNLVWNLRHKRYLLKYDNEKSNINLQNNVLKYCDSIILNNKYQEEHMLKNMNEKIKKKVIIIPHTYDKDFYKKNIKKYDDGKLHISYLGHLDKIRTAKPFLEALNQLKNKSINLEEKLVVEFYGNLDDSDKLYIINNDLYNIIKIKKPVTYFESLEIMQKSDWLLLIDANLGEFIPKNIFFAAKIADYLGSKTNIFGISMLEGASADILRETNCIISSHSVSDIYNNLCLIVFGKKKIKLKNQENYDIKNIVKIYDDLISKF